MNTITQTVVPSWIAIALGAATLFLIVAVVLLAIRAKRSGKAVDAKGQIALRRLFIAAVVAALLVIAAIMAISFVGLASFAEDDMGFTSWARLIVPFTLDGISVVFGFLAFIAVKRGRHPGRAMKIVTAGAVFSAFINFSHGQQEWTRIAGGYLAFLSLASAWLFHELLEQFMDQAQLPKARRNGIPVFGERWLWAPWTTLTARRAWIIYPPQPETEATVSNALAHHREVKAIRAADKAGKTITLQATKPKQVKGNGQPAGVSAPATAVVTAVAVPAHLVPLARSAAENHRQATGRTITADELAIRMNITPDVARQLLAQLGELGAPVLNGHAPVGVIR